MAAGNIVRGGTYSFVLTPTKDGTAWDLTAATVTLTFRKPDGTTIDRSATVAGGGVTASYVTLTTDLDTAGGWERVWHVVSGSVNLRSVPRTFQVNAY